jgi:hypothetical protein
LARFWNPVLKMLFNLTFSTTPRPDDEPWRMLAKRAEKLNIEEYFLGSMFLAAGYVAKSKGQTDEGSA